MRLLAPTIIATLSDAFVEGTEESAIDGLVSDNGRELATEDLIVLIDEAMRRFPEPAQSDPWFAPRLHAVLRLSRREAADRGIWLYLAIVDCPEYVRWRWGIRGRRTRFVGNDMYNALSRVWWSAELFRRGADYSPVETALSVQDIPNTLLRLKAAHNQAFCVALTRFVDERRSDGRRLTGRQINRLSTAINSQLFVTALDAVAPTIPTDGEARREWAKNPVPVDELIDDEPSGPADLVDPLFDEKVEAARLLLHRIADGAGIATHENPRAGSRRPGDVVDDD
jgi:hypothetical protein